MKNILTIDLEDWRQLVTWKMTGVRQAPSPRVVDEARGLLARLAARGVSATWFVLSNVAETFPDLVREIDRAGHEIASHGYSHSLIYRQTPEEFRTETRRAKELLQEILGKRVFGYRAAEFSITEKSWWAMDVLAQEGFTYDSSIYPISGKRYGMPEFSLAPRRVQTESGCTLMEFPLTAARWRGRRLPVAGGGYFRMLPYAVTRAAIRAVNREGRPAVAYFHPYEFASEFLRVPLAGSFSRRAYMFLRYFVVHNLARAQVGGRFTRLLNDFEFVPVREMLSVSTDQTVL